jgi:hypothetical protein
MRASSITSLISGVGLILASAPAMAQSFPLYIAGATLAGGAN